MEMHQVRYFLAAARTLNFTRAAEEVNKTQSAVSMQMKRLEETLGRPLFARDGRGSRLTRRVVDDHGRSAREVGGKGR